MDAQGLTQAEWDSARRVLGAINGEAVTFAGGRLGEYWDGVSRALTSSLLPPLAAAAGRGTGQVPVAPPHPLPAPANVVVLRPTEPVEPRRQRGRTR